MDAFNKNRKNKSLIEEKPDGLLPIRKTYDLSENYFRHKYCNGGN